MKTCGWGAGREPYAEVTTAKARVRDGGGAGRNLDPEHGEPGRECQGKPGGGQQPAMHGLLNHRGELDGFLLHLSHLSYIPSWDPKSTGHIPPTK